MERYVLLQVAFNVVFLANILYLHRRRQPRAVPVEAAAAAPKAPKAARRPLVLTLGLGPSPKPRREAPPLDAGLEALVAAAERAESAPAPQPAAVARQRAADDLRANLRRLKERLEREQGMALRS